MEDQIGDLLIYCRHGLELGGDGEWILDEDGCTEVVMNMRMKWEEKESRKKRW